MSGRARSRPNKFKVIRQPLDYARVDITPYQDHKSS